MNKYRSLVLVSTDPAGLTHGAEEVYAKFQAEIARFGLQEEISLRKIEDVGRNDAAPLVIIYPEATIYGPVKVEDVPFLVEEHLYKGRVAPGLQAAQKALSGRIAWISARKGTLPAENRVVLQRAGLVDPDSIEDYIMHNGFEALAKAVLQMTPQQVIDEIKNSGLRGRGGAGFPTGLKWGFVAKEKASPKYVICNADESEPGTFKDRVILEGDPFNMIEAMAIAAYAIGASEGYIYIRGEYALAQRRLKNAIHQAEENGLLGENIFGTDFSFHMHIHSGAGAYICGEETALIESIEGKRGEPRNRPPYPTNVGLWGKPTVVNNVETLANVTPIIRNGAAWYRTIGTPNSPGTKVYTILGNVNNTGLIEVPMGITLREIISIYANGMKDGATFKLAQTGGSSGSVIPAILQDTPMDFDSYQKAGVSLGSGALLICDDSTCVIDLAKVLMNFFRKESCGKCNPCRIGNERAYQILTNISEGMGSPKDVDDLLSISSNLINLSNCGLGQTSGAPLQDVFKHFRAELDAHIKLQVCPAGVCSMSKEHHRAVHA
jgi:NADP-reducing hydrogenase subunit HndC